MSAATLAQLADHALADAIVGGDAQALSVLYDRHSPIVYATCLRVLNDRAAADEVLVDVFHEFWRRADRYDPARGNVLTYLLTLARSRAIDRKRSSRRHAAVSVDHLPDTASDSADASTGAVASETAQRVRQALAQIDPEQRRAIEFAYYEGLSHSQIAQQLGRPLGTIKTYIRQGLMRLRRSLRSDDEPMRIEADMTSGASSRD